MDVLSLAPCVAFFHLLLLFSSSSSLRVAPEAAESSGSARHGRTAYHFQPAKNWQNDPNGPMYHNGMYHLFYQYNPHGATWGVGNLSWGHSVSGDLVNWAALDAAIEPTSPFDANGCWSGSATILPGDIPAILYTGISADGEQVQNVAFPKNASDPLLREWVKPSYNPVIPLPADVPVDFFRDPSTAWLGRDGLWRVAVSAKVGNVVGSTLIYRSKDFRRWERNAAPLQESRGAGMVECPDLFPVAEPGVEEGLDHAPRTGTGVRHVLKLSATDTFQDYYTVGRYNDTTDTFEPEDDGDDCQSWRRLDYGHVYASKSFFDARKNRRVLWAWANETDSQADDVAKTPRVGPASRSSHGRFGTLAGQRREAAKAMANRGDRDAEEQKGRVAGNGGELRRRERDRRRLGHAGGRGGGLRDPVPGASRELRAQLAAGSAETLRGEGRVRAGRGRPVRAARHGLRRPAGAHRRLLHGVQAPRIYWGGFIRLEPPPPAMQIFFLLLLSRAQPSQILLSPARHHMFARTRARGCSFGRSIHRFRGRHRQRPPSRAAHQVSCALAACSWFGCLRCCCSALKV